MDEYQSEGEPCFYYPIPGGLLDKDVIEITGTFYGERIVIEILGETYAQNGVNTALPMQFTLTINGEWSISTFSQTVSRRSQTGTCESMENFQIRIVAYEAMFEVYLNGTQICTQKHIIPLSHVSHILIDGEAEFTGVEFKDLSSENDDTSSASRESEKRGTASPKGIVPGFTRLSENRRSSNRKPKPPIMVPTHGSLRQRELGVLEVTQEETNSVSSSSSENGGLRIQAAPPAETVRASFESAVGATNPPAVVLSAASGGARDSKKKGGLRDKFNLKRSPKRSSSKPQTIAAQQGVYANVGGVNDVWVDQGGREVSVDGLETYAVAGAVSVPNLNSQKLDQAKEKKRHNILKLGGGGSKHDRAASTPPAGHTNDKNKKSKGHIGLHLHRTDKDVKTPKEPKTSKEGGKAHGKIHLGKGRGSKGGVVGAVAAGAAVVVIAPPGQERENEYGIALGSNESAVLPRPKSSSSSSRLSSRGKYAMALSPEAIKENFIKNTNHGSRSQSTASVEAGDYAVPSEPTLLVKSRPPRLQSRSSNSSSSGSKERRVEGPTVPMKGSEDHHRSRTVSSSTSRSSGTSRSLPHRASAFEATAAAGASKMDRGSKLKGDSPEIADNLLEGRRCMTNGYTSYTGTPVIVPLTITGKKILSAGSFTPIIGAKGSYNLEISPDKPTGTFRLTCSRSVSSAASDSPSSRVIRSSSVEPVHAARPEAASAVSKSTTLPAGGVASAGAGAAATALPAAGVVVGAAKGKDKKNKDKKTAKRQQSHSNNDGEDKLRKRDKVSAFFKRIFRRDKHGKIIESGVDEAPMGEMTELDSARIPSISSSASGISVSAKPSETCRYADQLRGGLPALHGNSPSLALCGTGHSIFYPLELDNENIAEVRRLASAANSGSIEPLADRKLSSSTSSSSESIGGTRHKRKQHQVVAIPQVQRDRSKSISSSSSSSSSWSLSANGTRRSKGLIVSTKRSESSTSEPSHTSVSDGGTRRHIRSKHGKHRPKSSSSSTSSSSYSKKSTKHEQSPILINFPQSNVSVVHAAAPRRSDSLTSSSSSCSSSASSITSLYGRVIIIGQSKDFQGRMQSYRQRMDLPRKDKSKRTEKQASGYGSDTSTSSISSMDSNSLPAHVMKVKGGNIAYHGKGSHTIFAERPKKPEDTRAFYTGY